MKKTILLCHLLSVATLLTAQTITLPAPSTMQARTKVNPADFIQVQSYPQCFNYSKSNEFGEAVRRLFLYAETGNACGTGALMQMPPMPGNQIIISGGRVNFSTVRGGHENRLSKALGTAYDKNFNINFDISVSNTGTGVGFLPVCLTSDWTDPLYSVAEMPANCSNTFPRHQHDVLAVHCYTPQPASSAGLMLGVQVLDNGVTVSSPNPGISINYETVYYITLKVYGNQTGELFVYKNAARTEVQSSLCFSMPRTVQMLGLLQHSTSSGAGQSRISTAWLDNTCIQRTNDECCKLQIRGNNVICNATTPAAYTITGNTDNVKFSVLSNPADVVASQTGGQTLTVTNWGTITAVPKQVKIIASRQCNCSSQAASDTMVVYVHPSLNMDFNISGIGNTGNLLNNFAATAVFGNGMTGVIHQWDIQTADAQGNPIAFVRPIYWSPGAANPATFIVTTAATGNWPALVTGQFYLINHVMYFNNQLCDGDGRRKLFIISKTYKLLDAGDPKAPGFKQRLDSIKSALN